MPMVRKGSFGVGLLEYAACVSWPSWYSPLHVSSERKKIDRELQPSYVASLGTLINMIIVIFIASFSLIHKPSHLDLHLVV